MDFDWNDEDRAFREELRAFIAASLPDDWDEISKGGPGSDAQARFSREFCGKLALRDGDDYRSEERRGGTGWSRTGRARWSAEQ